MTTFVADKRSAVEEAVTRDLNDPGIAKDSLVTTLNRRVEDEESERERLAKAAEDQAANFRTTEISSLDKYVTETEAAITATRALPKPEATDDGGVQPAEALAASDSFLAALRKQRSIIGSPDNKRRGRLQRQLVEYQRQQAVLQEQRRIVLMKGSALVKIQAKNLKASNLQALRATRDLEDHAVKVAARKDAAGKLMDSLDGLGSGISDVGGAITKMLTPVSDDDPAVVRLAEQMLVEDPVMRAAGKRLNDSLKAVMQRKQAKVAELVYWQRKISTNLATITSGLATQAALSRQRQSLAAALHPSVKLYLKQTRERAKDLLAESIYWFAKSHQYENLGDVEDTFYNFDTWTDLLRNQELEKVKPSSQASDEAERAALAIKRARYSAGGGRLQEGR